MPDRDTLVDAVVDASSVLLTDSGVHPIFSSEVFKCKDCSARIKVFQEAILRLREHDSSGGILPDVLRRDPTTLRRLRAGAEAKALLSAEPPSSWPEIGRQIDILRAGLAALQSLDDLGTESANTRVHNDMLEIQSRYDEIKRIAGS